MTPERRREEASELLEQLIGLSDDMSRTDRKFYGNMLEKFVVLKKPKISDRQLFWLRDLRDRYAL